MNCPRCLGSVLDERERAPVRLLPFSARDGVLRVEASDAPHFIVGGVEVVREEHELPGVV
jgi:hypothetical protein